VTLPRAMAAEKRRRVGFFSLLAFVSAGADRWRGRGDPKMIFISRVPYRRAV